MRPLSSVLLLASAWLLLAGAGFLEAMLEALQALGRKGDVHFLLRDRQHGAERDVIGAGSEPHDLPGADQVLG